jgi:hypothetical protein
MTVSDTDRMPERRWCFECPVCEYDHKEAGALATDQQIYCALCAGDCGRDVLLRRWLPEEHRADRATPEEDAA